MSKYLITMVNTRIFEVEVEAENLSQAEDLAYITNESLWVEDKNAEYTDIGSDHKIWNEDTLEWENC